ncbi:MAG: D-alanine--D-alanine ligase A [Candidatus Ryanbacteria bacterium RIFCSPLOWO2_01_FULL_48_26]|uniref:D-alanine--D-alanine ligase n=1 Tax=Candidatus Ryanbacteria bacterium RIFCSPLOWO2_01_FULL_48_26 TaxID=1802126 RepID=A0A1G2GT23_9BACT|nr:MAG: D-alanine--D-alanine ligase A [Candidatus Ryanbacteria bacterium RIFCSPLOWO2_01_FULL_48_26]
MKKKLKVSIVFGGKSGEHEVSLQSARSVYEALDKEKYELLLIGIDKSGTWHIGAPATYLLNSSDPKLIKLNSSSPAVTAIATRGRTEIISVSEGKKISDVDVFFPVTHGTFGEDGCLQGLLEFIDAAYVGTGVLGSAVGMDKDVMKRLLQQAGLPVGKFLAATRGTVSENFMKDAIQSLGFPIFVKPANLGSSVGISKAKNEQELEKAIAHAFQYDTKIILEKYIEGREIECAVLGNENPIASLPGEVIPTHDFYSYEAKYIDEHGAKLNIPAKLSQKETQEVQKLAVQAFKTLECQGMGRVDFFLTPKGEFMVNEINTLPGFTKISMYPKLWEATGIPYSELLDRLIQFAMEKKQEKDQLKRSFDL